MYSPEFVMVFENVLVPFILKKFMISARICAVFLFPPRGREITRFCLETKIASASAFRNNFERQRNQAQ